MLNFKRFEPQDSDLFRTFLLNKGEYSCENTLVNLLVWQDAYHTTFAFEDGQLLIKSEEEDRISFALPLGDDFEKGMALIRDYCGETRPVFWAQEGDRMKLFCQFVGADYDFLESRDDFDYLYSQTALAELSGKKYHGKRNHIAAFSKKYDWEYRPLSDSIIPDIRLCADEWYRENTNANGLDPHLQTERQGIETMLAHRQALNLRGGAVYVGGKAVAFTLGSPINSRVFDTHIEKALTDYAESYAVINREFAKTLSDFTYINREDDMGLPGLRRSKLSYKPAFLLKKYICRPRESA